MAEPIKLDEWLSELERLSRPAPGGGPPGFTTNDLEALGLTRSTAGNRIRMWVREGLVTCVGRRRTTAIDGRGSSAPVYGLTEKARAGTNRRRKR